MYDKILDVLFEINITVILRLPVKCSICLSFGVLISICLLHAHSVGKLLCLITVTKLFNSKAFVFHVQYL
jgi:hypothetical protein